MKRILAAALAVTLMDGTAFAAPPQYNQPNQGERARQQNPNEPNNQYNNQGNGQGGHHDRSRWSRGDRVPDQYRQNQYVVSNWQQYGLKRPPRGYQWVRNDYNDFYLVTATNGVVSETLYRDDRDQQWNRRYSRAYTYNDDAYYQDCRNGPDPAGVIAGGLIGALLGNAAGNHSNSSTIAGVVIGGAIGAALTKNLNCEDRSYAYKTYYTGFNDGRPNRTYQWNNPNSGDRGRFRVGSYYNDQGGFRCANYTQTVYIRGRAQTANGVACRQADGSWAVVR